METILLEKQFTVQSYIELLQSKPVDFKGHRLLHRIVLYS